MLRSKGIKRTVHFLALILSYLIWYCVSFPVIAETAKVSGLFGEGTKENPYLIRNVSDFEKFRDAVNAGEAFSDCWFYQTKNLDLQWKEWEPIGIYDSGKYFQGYYNGAGHYIEGLIIRPKDGKVNNYGLFGVLGGTVMNLGIETGLIIGDCVGSIASHGMVDRTPCIVNCYSRASLSGLRTGGIVDNFGNGMVINCWFDHDRAYLDGETSGNITSYSAVMIGCTNNDTSDGRGKGSKDQIKARVSSDNNQWIDIGMLYSGIHGIEAEMLYPWEWTGLTLQFAEEPFKPSKDIFEGKGTQDSPYLIQNYSDLLHFRYFVNVGEDYKNKWFRQTNDIEIETDDWIPIGVYNSGNYFYGIYDGAGHAIKGLSCKSHDIGWLDSAGLFGRLGGVVANLAVIEASVSGECCGIIASASAGLDRTMAIINCYVSGKVKANRPGGIADNLDKGLIACCISDVDLEFTNEEYVSEELLREWNENSKGGIVASRADNKVYGCYTTAQQTMPEAYRSATSASITQDELERKGFLLKQNLRIALAQQLFANHYDVELIQWQSLKKDDLRYGGRNYIILVSFLNEYLMVIVLGIIMLVTIIRLLVNHKKGINNSALLWGILMISAIISLFVDCAALGTAKKSLTIGRLVFIIQINGLFIFLLFLYLIRRKRNNIKPNWVLLVSVLILMGLELAQFDTVPRYDASLYYGSLARGSKLFRLDLLTYIGAFVCWKWAQGTALLIAPFEFLLPGQMIGVYISNVIITEVTVLVLYHLLLEMIPKINRSTAAFSSVLLVLCPYQLGMFTYLCFDNHCVYFAIWLIYSYRHKNDLFTAFCGYLLFFSKITGGVFYVVFLISMAMYEVITQYNGPLNKRITQWWKWSRCLLWMLPAFFFLFSMRWGEWFTIQHFNGANLFFPVGKKLMVSYENTVFQSFVFGFRWLFVVLITLAALMIVFKPLRLKKVLNMNAKGTLIATVIGCGAIVALLLVYNSDGECPRYTSLVNVAYVLLVPVAIHILFKKRRVRIFLSGGLAILLLIQTYWSIDPSIVLFRYSIDTGTNRLYRLASDDDPRGGMNLGMDYSRGYGSVGDIYAYNIEYNYYNDLINWMMRDLEPDENDRLYVLDVIDYELHLRGNQYFIYWDKENKKYTFDGSGDNKLILNVSSVATDDIMNGNNLPRIGSDFYLVVPARVDTRDAFEALERDGYSILEERVYRNIYGEMSVYHFQAETMVV